MAASLLFLLTVIFLTHVTQCETNTKLSMAFASIVGNKHHKQLFKLPNVTCHRSTSLIVTILLLAGDVETNPGPADHSTYPCGLCDIPVTWSCAGVCCDNCSIWHHKSCLELCSADYDLLHRSNVQWLCCKCDSVNVDSFTFHSFETSTNYYSPIQDSEITLDSLNSSVFSPLKASSPTRSYSTNTNNTTKSVRSDSNRSQPSIHTKQNLRILNINCRSIIDKKSKLTALLEYIKPDIVCGTESWLKGIKPGENPSTGATRSSEVFPSHYRAYRNDRGSLGGGVFILIHEDIISQEQLEFITKCEVEWVKIQLKGSKELFIGCYYMPHRNMSDLDELDQSLTLLSAKKDRHTILCGDFNCPEIDWATCSTTGQNERQIHQRLIDISITHGLTQIQEQPTRLDKNLDLVFTNNPSLIKDTTVIPGISDHDIVLVDSIIRPHYSSCKKRNMYIFSKANWDGLKERCTAISDAIQAMYTSGGGTKTLWSHFTSELLKEIKQHIPSKVFKSNNSPPWLTRKLRRLIRKKNRLHKQARKTNNWGNYRQFQRECKRTFRRAEWSYVNNVIVEGLSNNNSKPFWRYVKSKKQDNIGVSPLKHEGILHSDSKSKAEILLNQFCSVFTKCTSQVLPSTSRCIDQQISNITIIPAGVEKLLTKIKISKAPGPDNIPNQVLKECAHQLAPAISCIFQRSLDSGELPEDWTNANIAPVFKKGNRHLAENYRPGGSKTSTIPGLDPTTKEDGNLADITRAGSLHEFLMDLHKQFGPIASFWMGRMYVVSIASPELFKEHQGIFDRPPELFQLFEPLLGPKSVLYANKTDGRARRNRYHKVLSHDHMKHYFSKFQEVADELEEKWSSLVKEEHVPLSQYISAFALKAMLQSLFGQTFKGDKEIREFRSCFDVCWAEMEHRLTDRPDPKSPRQKAFDEALCEAKKFIRQAIQHHKDKPSNPGEELLIDVLLEHTSDEETVLSDAISYAVGGFHTTGNLLTWCFYFLATHLDVQEKVYREIKDKLGKDGVDHTNIDDIPYARQVLDETLRCCVLAPWAARFQDFDTELGGHKLPKNTPVIHALGVSLQDEKYWPLPNKFDPDRFLPANVKSRPTMAFQPYGFAGKRICPGYRFAYGDSTVCLVTLIRKFKVTLVEGQVVNPVHGLVTHPEEEIWIKIEKR